MHGSSLATQRGFRGLIAAIVIGSVVLLQAPAFALDAPSPLSLTEGTAPRSATTAPGTSIVREPSAPKLALPLGTVTLADANADGYLNAAEIAAVPEATWSGPGDATSAQVWFDDGVAIDSANNCGKFSVGPTGVGALNLQCGTAMPQGTLYFRGQWFNATTSSPVASVSLIKDTIAPAASILVNDGDGVISNAEASAGIPVSGQVTDSGPAVTVTAANTGNTPAAECTFADLPRTFSTSLTPACLATLGEGAIEIKVTGSDVAGNPGTATDTSVIDRVGPAAPTGLGISPSQINSSTQHAVTVSGTGTGEIAHISLTDGTTTISADVPATSGTFSHIFDAGLALDDGTLTATAALTDAVGNLGSEATATAQMDTLAPDAGSVVLGDVDGYINAAEAANNVAVYWDGPTGATSASIWFANQDGSIPTGCGPFSQPIDGFGWLAPSCTAALQDGQISARATWVDSFGNVSSESIAVSTLDRVAPTPTVAFADSEISSANVSSVDLGGATEPGATVTVTLSNGSSSVSSTVVADGLGDYAATFDASSLPDGTVNASALAKDVAGNQGTVPGTSSILKDTTANAPAIDVVETYITPAGQAEVHVTVNGEAGSTVAVSLSDSASGSTPTQDAEVGETLIFDASTLAEGTITASGVLTDTLGNVSAAGTDTAIKDTLGPAAGTLALLDPNNDGFLNKTEANAGSLTGQWTSPGGDAATATVWFVDKLNTMPPANCGTFSGAATGTVALNATCANALPQGTFSFVATWTDAAGNTGASTKVSLVKDTIAELTMTPEGSVVGSTFTVTGQAEPNRPVSLTEGATALGATTAAGNGSYSFSVSGLSNGAHTLTASTTDAAGNASSVSKTVTVDPSNLPVITRPVADSVNAALVNVAGTAKPSAFVEVFEGTTMIARTQSAANGVWSVDTGFANGSHTIKARAIDGSTSTGFSSPVTFTVDGSPPTVAIDNADMEPNPAEITGTAADAAGGVVRIELRYFNNLTGGLVAIRNAACTGCGVTGASVTWSDTPVGTGWIRVEAVAVDAVGQRSSSASIRYIRLP